VGGEVWRDGRLFGAAAGFCESSDLADVRLAHVVKLFLTSRGCAALKLQNAFDTLHLLGNFFLFPKRLL